MIAGIYAYKSHLALTLWVGIVAIVGFVSLPPAQRRRKLVDVPKRKPSFASMSFRRCPENGRCLFTNGIVTVVAPSTGHRAILEG